MKDTAKGKYNPSWIILEYQALQCCALQQVTESQKTGTIL